MAALVDVVSSKVDALDQCAARHSKLATWARQAAGKPKSSD